MIILVTGGTGFIGSHLVHRLLEKKHKVIVIKRSFSPLWRIQDILNDIHTYDIDKLPSIESIFKDHPVDAVMHLAAKYVKYDNTNEEIPDMTISNVQFPSFLVYYAIKHGAKVFINTGTFFEYESTFTPINELTPKQPFNYYTATKIAFEDILKYDTFENKIRALSLKLFSPYGEKDNNKIIQFIIESFLKQKKAPLTAGEQQLSFTYVEDIVDAYISALNFALSERYKQYEDFNIGHRQTHSLRDIIRKLEDITASTSPLELGKIPYNPREIMSAQCNPEKARRILGWEAKTNIDVGLKHTYDYYKKLR